MVLICRWGTDKKPHSVKDGGQDVGHPDSILPEVERADCPGRVRDLPKVGRALAEVHLLLQQDTMSPRLELSYIYIHPALQPRRPMSKLNLC